VRGLDGGNLLPDGTSNFSLEILTPNKPNKYHMPSGDKRYSYVRSVFMAGDLKTFSEMFNIVPRSIVATDLGLNYDRFAKKIIKLELLTIRDIRRLAKLTGVGSKDLLALVDDEIEAIVLRKQQTLGLK
jgi:hypothetical protein